MVGKSSNFQIQIQIAWQIYVTGVWLSVAVESVIEVVPLKMELLAHLSMVHTQPLKGTCFLARCTQFSKVVANQQKFHSKWSPKEAVDAFRGMIPP